MSQRPYQIILFGATGFTGRLVAEYLYSAYPPGHDQSHGITWAMAARDLTKLHHVKADLGAHGIDLFAADADDANALEAITAQAEVIITTVGPYARYGSTLVATCVKTGTDYCDLSGEVPWMRRMIEAHHRSALASGVRVVHSCGFDSVPSDIGVLHLQQSTFEQWGEYCESVEMIVAAAKGGFSGGTFASLDNVLVEARASDKVASILLDPYSLNHPAPDGLCQQREQRTAGFSESFQTYTAPFVMASINTRIVRRSSALAGFPYGRNFCYSEAVATGEALGGRLTAQITALGIGVVSSAGPVGQLIRRLSPKPGTGPAADAREAGFFKLKLCGKTASGKEIRTSVRGKRDPGYGCTSRMLAESAVALAQTRGQGRTGGVLTPALAIGQELLVRLPTNAEVSFRVDAMQD